MMMIIIIIIIIIITATKNSNFILLILSITNITLTQYYKLAYTLGFIHFGTVQVKVSRNNSFITVTR
jgi:hypothetical protein